MKPSPEAAKRLAQCDSYLDAEETMGETDCPNDCHVEPDGYCSHGYKSAALTLGVI